MFKYRKKPVEIEAVQLTQNNILHVLWFMGQEVDLNSPIESEKYQEYSDMVIEEGMKINTLEGVMTASMGDFIIKGVKGEFYPCKPDIFEMTYEKVEQ